MDRRKFLEKFVKASGVSLVAGVCVACPAPGPRRLFMYGIDYKDLDGVFKSHSCKIVLSDFKNEAQGIPISTKYISLFTDYVLDVSNNIRKIEKNLNIYSTKNGKKEYLAFKVLKVYNPSDFDEDPRIDIELKEQLSYNTVYTIEANKDILSDESWSDIEPGSNWICFRTTTLELSTEKIEITEGDTKIVNVKKAFYKDKVFTSFDKVSIEIPNVKNKDKNNTKSEIVKTTVDGNDIILEAQKQGDVMLEVLAQVQDGEQLIEFYTHLYVKVK